MAAPQVAVIGLLLMWGRPVYAALVGALLLGQFALMPRLLANPRKGAAAYNATGTTLYVLGMLTSALALRAVGTGPL
jgi:chlorophyll synthase